MAEAENAAEAKRLEELAAELDRRKAAVVAQEVEVARLLAEAKTDKKGDAAKKSGDETPPSGSKGDPHGPSGSRWGGSWKPNIPSSLKHSMFSKITAGLEPEGEAWDDLTKKLTPKKVAASESGKDRKLDVDDPPARHAQRWNIMQVQLEGYKDLRSYRPGSSFTRWMTEFEDSLPGGALELGEKVDLLRTKLANPQQVLLKSVLAKLGKSEEPPTWQMIKTSLIKLAGGTADIAKLVFNMKRTYQKEEESFRDWTARAIEELSNSYGRQPEDGDILEVITGGANVRCLQYMQDKGFDDLADLVVKMDRFDQREAGKYPARRRLGLDQPLDNESRKRAKTIDLCLWCSQEGHINIDCRNDKYCNICAEGTHPRRDCEIFKEKKVAAEKKAEAEAEAKAKAKIEILQAETALPDPPAQAGRGGKRRKPTSVSASPPVKAVDTAFAGVKSLEESRADWQGQPSRGRGRGRGRGGGRGGPPRPPPPAYEQKGRKPMFDPFKDGKCYRCADPNHTGYDCPRRGETCSYCNKPGHLAARCYEQLRDQGYLPPRRQQGPRPPVPPTAYRPPYQPPQVGGAYYQPQAGQVQQQLPPYPPQPMYLAAPAGYPQGPPPPSVPPPPPPPAMPSAEQTEILQIARSLNKKLDDRAAAEMSRLGPGESLEARRESMTRRVVDAIGKDFEKGGVFNPNRDSF